MDISEKRVQEMKNIMQKDSKEEITDEQAREASYNLTRYIELVYEVAMKQARNEKRLKKEPKGFPIEGHYSCLICHTSIGPETGWYHWGGQRCLNCHRAIANGVIPAYMLKNDKSYFRIWYLANTWKVRTVSIRKMVREGKLKARDITDEKGGIIEQIFLKADNPDLIERYSPERKSYDRHREKMSRKSSRELRNQMMKDLSRKRKRFSEKI